MKKHIDIDGMSCEHCANAVKNVLEELGAINIVVDPDAGWAEADIAADNASIAEKIEEEGFEAVGFRELDS